MYINQKVGKKGEKIAQDYLKQNGYKIINQNFFSCFGEIDIIAIEVKTIVFIEVKTRTSLEYGLPAEAVTKMKLKHLYKTAEYYLYKSKMLNLDIRFDVIEIYIDKKMINHLKNII